MRYTCSIFGAIALLNGAAAREQAVNEVLSKQLYESGVMMERIMEKKQETWDRQRRSGAMESSQYPPIDHFVPCINGKAVAIPHNANYTFNCKNIDLYNFKSHADLGSKIGAGSSSWGWTSRDGREFVALGQADGAAFVEITEDGEIEYLGRLPQPPGVEPKIWREIRGFKSYMVIGSEAEGHGIQIFDMRKLLDVDSDEPVVFSNEKDLTGHFTDLPIGMTHNVVVNEETNFAYSVGAKPRNSTCRSGLIAIDLSDPSNPVSPGCASEDGYVHDAQCLVYRGPHTKYRNREVCYGFDESKLTIFDVTDKKNPKIISRTSYDGASYTHQGWVLDKYNQEWLILDDEYDEVDKKGPAADGFSVTYIWDIRDLENPKNTGYYKSKAHSIDHNQYVHDGKAYQSNYGAGFRILDVSSIPHDPTGGSVEELGFFDVYPEDDNMPDGGSIDFVGTWSSYSYFKSGYLFVNTMERGAFVLKYRESDD